ncbi:hypothetical protein KP2612_003721 [Komagataella phaffii]|uniref:DMAP1-binding domain-containing protein n=1 Tax=Komagataella phaffii (strain GS115 / ATCC 20864) TaxID=644223 RepID=C4R4T6_KOMPG|nr:uncharacterized protein PAS_chr3_0523 [Komagataella phaffii GS115]AOA64313.1 GQ67_03596T0 [Komagataella phaffii]AOA69317.1 GQ68_03567T0 [Komagataella phaffii GS115]CAH2449666.1 Hypothetical protein BQ9382_C3-3625 [Komagataella phaffii CBS 7435]CAY70572.1 Putative protein of unknown function [Komagataella phaffii GS115]
MDFPIPMDVPQHIIAQLSQLRNEYEEGLLTEKGYIKKREKILNGDSPFVPVNHNRNSSVVSSTSTPISPIKQFDLATGEDELYTATSPYPSQNGTNYRGDLSSTQDRTSYAAPSLYSNQNFNRERAGRFFQNGERVELQKPLDPRDLADESNLESFDNLPSILRQRATNYKKEIALLIIDQKGKESSSISWEKLYLKAERIAQQIRNKSGLYRGDRVCLVYHQTEVVEFAVALFGCFLSGVVAIPLSSSYPIKELVKIMNDTQAHLCLMSESSIKLFERTGPGAQTKTKWPKGMDIWKSTDMGTYQQISKKNDSPALQVPDLAYIEYSKSPTGELRGVVLSHRTIMHQMNSITSILSSMPDYDSTSLKRSAVAFNKFRNVILSTLDPRQSSGLIIGILYTIYSGNLLVWTAQKSMETPGLYAHIISKYEVNILLADYLGLKQVTYNYQSFPQLTRTYSKKIKVNLKSVKWCLINSLTVEGDFHQLLIDRWFTPLGCTNAHRIVAPVLSLSEYGGMIISMRDWLGGEERLGYSYHKPLNDDLIDSKTLSSDLSELLIDRASLMTNTVKVVSDKPPATVSDTAEYLRVGAFGYPIPDATLAIVNPETNILSANMEVGEIWVDSPCISGGFWGLSDETNTIFHAKCSDYEGVLDLEFLRTGLLGFTYNGKVYILGLYEDRLRQRVTWRDRLEASKADSAKKLKSLDSEYQYHYSSHLVKTLVRNIKEVEDCSFFDIFINQEYLPVAIVETKLAKQRAQKNGVVATDKELLEELSSKCIKVLEDVDNVKLYCILVVPPLELPRTGRHGRLEIANMLCKRKFNEGRLTGRYIKFNVSHAVSNISKGDDITGGIWSQYQSKERQKIFEFAERQYSGLDYREESVDDRTNAPLTDFKTIVDILAWRAANQAEELAFSMVDKQSIKELKPLSWKKFDQRVSALCSYIVDKQRFSPGDYVILMYTLSEEFVIALYACFKTGLIPIPVPALDPNRAEEDVQGFVGIVKDFKVARVFANTEVEALLKMKQISHELRRVALNAKLVIPKIKNTTKYTKVSQPVGQLNSKISKFQAGAGYRKPFTTALILTYWTSDQYRICVRFTHANIMGLCKVFKETCQVSSIKPLLACVRHHSGIGFVQSSLLGVFVGASTYLVPPMDYSSNPKTLFLALSRYKVTNTFGTDSMLNYAVQRMDTKRVDLGDLKNFMLSYSGRPDCQLYRNFLTHFVNTQIPTDALSNVYSHPCNPMITSRSYLSFEPVDLWLDPIALSQGYVSLVNPKTNHHALHLQDSGIVPVCTQIAIVNPETLEMCSVGEYGEIWVCSEANAEGFVTGKGRTDSFAMAQFQGKLKGGENGVTYFRTGDFGFLHNVSKTTSDNSVVDLQLLFVLGQIAETIEVLGLQYFPCDIEKTVERIYDILSTCLFKCDGYAILVVEPRKNFKLSSLVPVIVNTVLNVHHLMLDIVAFVEPGSFPRSRLNEKQRARIIDRWNSNTLQLCSSYGTNYGEKSMIELVQRIDQAEFYISNANKKEQHSERKTEDFNENGLRIIN